jgi:hypothetical protein
MQPTHGLALDRPKIFLRQEFPMARTATWLAFALALGLIFGGTGFAGDPEFLDQPSFVDEPAAAMEGHESVELTGTILSDNTFVDEDGEQYLLSESEKNEELQAIVGEKIKVTASVMEDEAGAKSILISNYELVTE